MAPNEQIKLCKVNGVLPTYESIQRREYIFTTEVYVVTLAESPEESSGVMLRRWLLSAEGQEAIQESGYVPVREVKGDR
jgi:phosphate transport system substrate-binding protein